MKIAIIDKAPSNVKYDKYFEFEFENLHMSDIRIKKLLKKDITLVVDLEDYDYVILVGSEAAKNYAKITSVTQYQGHLVDDKFMPVINPAMLAFKPEGKPAFMQAVKKIHQYVEGNVQEMGVGEYEGIEDETIAKEHCKMLLALSPDVIDTIAVDTETTSLYPRDGYVLGISLSYKANQGVYISTDVIDEELEKILQQIFLKFNIVMHNAKFDLHMLEYHFNFKFPRVADTMLMHYDLDETPGTHGLKPLAMKYCEKLGDYDKALVEFRSDYCKVHKIKQADFTYDLIPFDVLSKYAAMDTAATIELYKKFQPIIYKSPNLKKVYERLLVPGMRFLKQVEDNGVPFDKERLVKGQTKMDEEINRLHQELYSFSEVHTFEELQGKVFNPNSPMQLRILLFDILGLKPVPGKKTGTGAISTDAEVLTTLAKEHELPGAILGIRKASKIKNTYLDKIIPALDADSRLRTGFNLTSTTSGRLSSSGKLNMQQLPRDNKIVKACIKATPGHKIVSQDLATAEMYVAAVLSEDKVLQDVFVSGGDFHSSMAHRIFGLPCKVEDVTKKFKKKRQAAKAISFGILYGSGPEKVAETAGVSIDEAKDAITEYFETFHKLKNWLDTSKKTIKANQYIYSIFGRKRRVPNVISTDRGIAGHEVRSAVNFLIQSVASDINLLAGIDMQNYIEARGMKTKIFGLVHDSILAEVPDEEMNEYCEKLEYYTKMDRGCSIPGAPVGVDLEIGDDYSFVEEEPNGSADST
jgi:DNA polymerase I-like protein with 3'-5' exonuclease and polymerase domains